MTKDLRYDGESWVKNWPTLKNLFLELCERLRQSGAFFHPFLP
jgi:hypothetical protein